MSIDEVLKNNLIADVENIADTNLRPQTKAALKRAFEITIGHHYSQSHFMIKEMTDEIIEKGAIALLESGMALQNDSPISYTHKEICSHEAQSFRAGSKATREWYRSQIKYLASQSHPDSYSLPGDEEISDKASEQVSLYLKARNNPAADLHKRFVNIAKWMRSQFKPSEANHQEKEAKPKRKYKKTTIKICAGCGSFAHGNPGHDIT